MENRFEIPQTENDRFSVRTLQNPVSDCHYHSQIELLYIEHGSISVTVGNNEATLCDGGLAAVGSFELHGVRALAPSVVKVVSIPVRKIADFQAVFRKKTFARAFCTENTAEFGELIDRLETATEKDKTLSAKGYAYILLDKATELLGLVTLDESAGEGSGVVREMLSYMDEHFTEDLSLEQIAADLGYNRDYLSRVFNGAVGTGFCRYLNYMRINYATRLIATTELSAERISDMSGFGSVHSFYNSFREVCGCTPGQYRRRVEKRTPAASGLVTNEIHESTAIN